MKEGSVNNTLELFKNLVGIKFQLYNSLFTALPFHRVEKTGILLSLFLIHCEENFAKEESPEVIINYFLKQYTNYQTEKEQVDLLFRFVQYTERQVVLFDALEDAAFSAIHDTTGKGTLKHLQSEVLQYEAQEQLKGKLKDFSVRLVLTAHPTQFYPSEVLGIIHDLSRALIQDNTSVVNTFLQQLGKTPFLKKEKPTPYDEAMTLLWYLENIFYPAAGKILQTFKNDFPEAVLTGNRIIRMGFWPGGDRDGNPFVNKDITLKVAAALRGGIMACYYRDVRRLKRRLTFKGVSNILSTLEEKLYQNVFVQDTQPELSAKDILSALFQIKETLISRHNRLFVYLVDELISKVEVFGLFFASLDIRQDSSVHRKIMKELAATGEVLPKGYEALPEQEKIKLLANMTKTVKVKNYKDELLKDTFQTMAAVKTIQQLNGEEGCNRYIISHTTSAVDVMEVYGMLLMSGWKKALLTMDIIPLFETIDDLRHADSVMKELYENKTYRSHLQKRNNKQTIMLGFSDGTKDGGYLMANWSIYKAKERLTSLSRQYGVHVVFFDGRGGPPARGGGKTHQFYASMGQNIANQEIQLTIQGQTISSNFGTPESAQFNMEQLIHAGISNGLFSSQMITLSQEDEAVMQTLAEESYKAFNKLKLDPDFLEYLNYASPLRYYAETNIASRPSSRNKSARLNLNDLRAVPYVGAWSQIKQNVPGYYGVGTALEKMEKAGKWEALKHLYEHSLFFKTMLDNCEMAMKKSFFPLTAYLKKHSKYSKVWKMIYDEFEKTMKYVFLLTGETSLMDDHPVDQLSIQMRERIVLPLLTIQQFALIKIRELEEKKGDAAMKQVYETLVIRCSFGIINAGRNSA
jgi:phosphoenolpyruvate carboxylase